MIKIIAGWVSLVFFLNFLFNLSHRKHQFLNDIPVSVAGLTLAYQWYSDDPSKYTRELTCIVLFFLVEKMMYYLKLFDNLAPLLSIIQQIERDIASFLVCLIIVLVMFSLGF